MPHPILRGDKPLTHHAWPHVPSPSSSSLKGSPEDGTASLSTCSDFDEKWSSSGRNIGNVTSISANFPTYVVSIRKLLELDRLPVHEDALMSGLIEEIRGKDACIHFISQRWLSAHHPDPEGVKLRRFQSVCRQIMDGNPRNLFSDHDWESFSTGSSSAKTFRSVCSELRQDTHHLHPDAFREDILNGYVWWDYLSVPQSRTETGIWQQSMAINSIPHYIERSAYFWVLVPEAEHSETRQVVGYEDWLSRGWCRLEEWGNFLSVRVAPPLILTNSPTLGVLDVVDFLMIRSGIGGLAQHAACEGRFSCCEAGHKQTLPNGKVVKLRCDKEYVGAVLKQMYDSKLKHYEAEGKCMLASLLHNSAQSVFAGTSMASPPSTLPMLLENCGADSVNTECYGLPPLAWACTYGSTELVQELLDAGARADQSVSILHCAAQQGSPDVLQLLLNSGHLDSEAVSKGSPVANITSLDRGAKTGHAHVCSMLLRAGASPHCVRRDNGATPLHTAAECGHAAACQVLIDAGAQLDAVDKFGCTPLRLAASGLTLFGSSVGKSECARLLLQAKANPDIADQAQRLPADVAMEDGHNAFLEALAKYKARRFVEPQEAEHRRPRHEAPWPWRCISCAPSCR